MSKRGQRLVDDHAARILMVTSVLSKIASGFKRGNGTYSQLPLDGAHPSVAAMGTR
jgi:hypothetical protein